MTEDEAMAMIVRRLRRADRRELPNEYALELNRLIELRDGMIGRLNGTRQRGGRDRPVASVHAFRSTSPGGLPVAGRREEEWRFTPLRRCGGLHATAPHRGRAFTFTLGRRPAEVTVEAVQRARGGA